MEASDPIVTIVPAGMGPQRVGQWIQSFQTLGHSVGEEEPGAPGVGANVVQTLVAKLRPLTPALSPKNRGEGESARPGLP